MLIYFQLVINIFFQLDFTNSANQAIELLIRKGVPEDRIIFLNLISVKVLLLNRRLVTPSSSCSFWSVYSYLFDKQAPEGVHCVCKRFPHLKIVTSEIDGGLNDEYRVIPGLGEYGDRYFGID